MGVGRSRVRLAVGALAALAAVSGLSGLVGMVAGVGIGPAGASRSSNALLAKAKQALLVRSDFPSGWSSVGSVTTSNGGSSSFPGASQLASCLGVSSSLINLDTPSANSPTFQSKGGVDTVEDSTSIFSSANLANRERAAISSPKVPGCMTTIAQGPARQAILGSVGQGVTIGTITATAVPRSDLAGKATGFTMSFLVTSKGVTVQAHISIISMVRGRMGNQMTVEAAGAAFPASLERHLVSIAYGRT